MKRKFNNSVHLEGYLYENKLEEKVTGPNSKNPGTPFINGNLSIATDDEFLNVVQVHFSYVTPTTSKGGPNPTYNTLKAIIDRRLSTIMDDGAENADRVRIDSAIGLNEWYDSRTEGNPLISVKRNEGGFVHQFAPNEQLAPIPEGSLKKVTNPRAKFDVDMLIMKATRYEADEERQQPERMALKGYIFDFRNSLLPIELTVLSGPAMNYFESQDISEKNPFFTHLQGNQISQTVTRETTEESAFGDAVIKTTTSSYRDFVVTWAAKEPYEWDDESTLLATELQELQANRELYLAGVKKRQDEYQATRGNALSAQNAAPAKKQPYDF